MNDYILVVEDQALVAKDIQVRLQTLGYLVPYIVSSGEIAVDIAFKTSPDLVVMDIHLNGELDGIETAEQICSICNARIVYLTAYVDQPTMERALATNPKGYVLKPFNRKKLGEIIESALAA